jgi:hypothetical protein
MLHCDTGVGYILLTVKGRSLLIDWELTVAIDEVSRPSDPLESPHSLEVCQARGFVSANANVLWDLA